MRIASSNVALGSAYQYRASLTKQESLNFWVGDRRPPARNDHEPDLLSAPSAPPTPPPPVRPPPTPNAQGKCDSAKGKKTSATDDAAEDAELDPATLLIKKIIEKLFGGRIHMSSLTAAASESTPSDPLPQLPSATSDEPTREGWGLEYQSSEVREESEQMQFAAAGVVRTADGKEINFSLALNMQRYSRQEERFQLKAGDALIDPLVLNFDGSAAQLRSGTFNFDLNSDGKSEQLPLLGSGTAVLALDRNSDGQINNGSELFGPTTGQGFAELRALDSDGNGWIDESDSSYDQLRLWQPTESGPGELHTLAEKNVGAIYLQSAATPFTFKNEAQETQATTSASGIFLQENGTAGTVQQLNFVA